LLHNNRVYLYHHMSVLMAPWLELAATRSHFSAPWAGHHRICLCCRVSVIELIYPSGPQCLEEIASPKAIFSDQPDEVFLCNRILLSKHALRAR
jgi:hypothetical protein